MTEKSFHWPGTEVGDAALYAPIDAQDMADILYALFCAGECKLSSYLYSGSGITGLYSAGGVIRGYLNELEVTTIGSLIQMDSGAALVGGRLYETDSSVSWFSNPDDDYLVALYASSGQTIRASLYTVSSTWNQVRDKETPYYMFPVAFVRISGGVATVNNDLRLFLGGRKFAPPVVCARQGGSSSDMWTDAGTTSYDIDSSIGMFPVSLNAVASAGQSLGKTSRNDGIFSGRALAFGQVYGNSPDWIIASSCDINSVGANILRYDGASLGGDVDFGVLGIGEYAKNPGNYGMDYYEWSCQTEC